MSKTSERVRKEWKIGDAKRDAGLIFSAVSDNVLSVPPPVRDSLRAAIVKSMLIEVCK